MRTRPMTLTLAALPLAVLLAAAVPAPAQMQGGSHDEVNDDFRQEFLRDFDQAARKFVMLAEAMPAEVYDWRPMEGVASPAEVYIHVARYNYYYPEIALDIAAPAGIDTETMEDHVPGRNEVIRTLERSMEHVRQVVEAMPKAQLQEPTRLYGRDVTQRAVMLQLLTHMHEHLGQSIAYARMNRIVPPWSR